MNDSTLSNPDAQAKLVAVPVADLERMLARASQRWYPVIEAAIYSGLSEASVRRLISSGQLSAHRPVKGKVLIDRFELDSLIGNATATPRTGRGRGRA